MEGVRGGDTHLPIGSLSVGRRIQVGKGRDLPGELAVREAQVLQEGMRHQGRWQRVSIWGANSLQPFVTPAEHPQS